MGSGSAACSAGIGLSTVWFPERPYETHQLSQTRLRALQRPTFLRTLRVRHTGGPPRL